MIFLYGVLVLGWVVPLVLVVRDRNAQRTPTVRSTAAQSPIESRLS